MLKGFNLFLLLVSLLHVSLLWLKLQDEQQKKNEKDVLHVRLQDETQKKRQIVQSEDPKEKTDPKEDAYLSDKDRSFDRQSKARRVDPFKQSSPGGGGTPGKAEKLKLSDLSAGGENPLAAAARDYTKNKNNKQNGDPKRQAQVSSTNDHLEDVPLGDLTQLNTTEHKYYGFYYRIRQKLEQFWGKSIQEKAESIIKDGRQLASGEELITALRITLNGEGQVIRIELLDASGVKELDEAAIESFNQAGPFPNPPKDMIVKGKVILEWGFVVRT